MGNLPIRKIPIIFLIITKDPPKPLLKEKQVKMLTTDVPKHYFQITIGTIIIFQNTLKK